MPQDATIPGRSLEGQKVPFEVLKYIPEYSAAYYKFVPIGLREGILEVGMVNPDNNDARDALQFIASKTGIPFKIFEISEPDFQSILESYKGLGGEISTALTELTEEVKAEREETTKAAPIKPVEVSLVEEAPVTKIVSVMLQHAVGGGASDIHIEPGDKRVKVRFRVDGALYNSLFLPMTVHEAVVARIKILTNMLLDEKRKPQDGRFSTVLENRQVDFRVSTFPTYFGEKVVIRILDPESKLLQLDAMGFSGGNLEIIRRAIDRPYGLILITGPTGSGKTTTLYSMMNELEKEKYNVVSLEDPIEYNIPGISQSQVRPEIGYSFANGLRSILRQDPDIILVGEIRDKETARLAIHASLTGHLVFSTLHTNNTAGVIPRLIDMGIEPYLIPPTLILAVAQRLVPLICADSKQPIPVEGSIKVMLDKQFADLPETYRKKLSFPKEVYRAVRSPVCPGGTKGRIAVVETMEMTKDLEQLILKLPGESEVYKLTRSQGFLSMKEDAMFKAFAGLIPFEEVDKL